MAASINVDATRFGVGRRILIGEADFYQLLRTLRTAAHGRLPLLGAHGHYSVHHRGDTSGSRGDIAHVVIAGIGTRVDGIALVVNSVEKVSPS